MELLPGDIVVHGINARSGWVSKQIGRVTGSPWCHVALAIGADLLVEGWYPTNQQVRWSTRRAALEREGTPYRVLRYPRPLETHEAVALIAEATQHVGTTYAWYQIGWYALTGWFSTRGNRVICSRLVPAAWRATGLEFWDTTKVATLPTSVQTQLYADWATPADIVRYSNCATAYDFGGTLT